MAFWLAIVTVLDIEDDWWMMTGATTRTGSLGADETAERVPGCVRICPDGCLVLRRSLSCSFDILMSARPAVEVAVEEDQQEKLQWNLPGMSLQ